MEVLQATFSNTFLKMSICLVEFNCSVFPMIYWKINQHWSGNCLVLNSQHVTTDRYQWWHWCISTPLSLNGLKCHFADIFKWIFITEKMNLWVQFHRSKFLMVQLTLYVWFRQWLSNRLVTSHYLNRWWQDFCRHMVSPGLSELTHYGQALWCQMATQIWVNTGSGNGSFLDGSKPVPESVFTNYQWGIVAFNWRR